MPKLEYSMRKYLKDSMPGLPTPKTEHTMPKPSKRTCRSSRSARGRNTSARAGTVGVGAEVL
eukprot:6746514-Alexandrium_andersonii.AAC.1